MGLYSSLLKIQIIIVLHNIIFYNIKYPYKIESIEEILLPADLLTLEHCPCYLEKIGFEFII